MANGKKDEPGLGEAALGYAAGLFPGAAALGAGAYGIFKLFESGKQDLTDEEIEAAKVEKRLELKAKKAIISPKPVQLEKAYRPTGEPLPPPVFLGGTTDVPLHEYQQPSTTETAPYGKTITIYDKESGETYEVPAAQLYGEPGQEVTYKGKKTPLVQEGAPLQLMTGKRGEQTRMVFDRTVTDINPGNLLGGTGGDIFKTLKVGWGVPSKDTKLIDFMRQRVPGTAEQGWAESGKTRFFTNREAINWFEGVFPTYQEKVIRRKKKTKERPIPKDLAVSKHGVSDDPRQKPDLTKEAPFWQKRDSVKEILFQKRNELAKQLEKHYRQVSEGKLDHLFIAKQIEKEIVGLSSRKEYSSLFFTDKEEQLANEFAKLDPRKRYRWLQRHKNFLDKVQPFGTIPRQGYTVDRAIMTGKWARIRIPVQMYTQDQWRDTTMRLLEQLKSRVRVPIHVKMGHGPTVFTPTVSGTYELWARAARKDPSPMLATSPVSNVSSEVAAHRIAKGESLPLAKAEALIEAYSNQIKEVTTPEHVRRVAERLHLIKARKHWSDWHAEAPFPGLPKPPTDKALAPFLAQARNVIAWELWRDLVEHGGEWEKKDISHLSPEMIQMKAAGIPITAVDETIGPKIENFWKWFMGELPEESTWFDIPWTDGRYGIGLGSERHIGHGALTVAKKVVDALGDAVDIYAGDRSLGVSEKIHIPADVLRRDARDSRSNAVIDYLRLDDPDSSWHGLFGLRWNDKANWDPKLNNGKGGWRGGWVATGTMASWMYDGPQGEDIKIEGRYDGMGPWEVAGHVAENMPEEVAGLVMLFPHLGELFIDALAEPFSGRSSVESAERFNKMTGAFINALVDSLALHLGDPKAGLVEEGALTQFLWFLPIGALAKFGFSKLVKTKIIEGFKRRITNGEAPLIETGRLVLEEGKLRPKKMGEKTLFDEAQIELQARKKAHKKAAEQRQKAWKLIRDRVDKETGKVKPTKSKKKRVQRKHEKQAEAYEAALDAEARLAQNVQIAEAAIRQFETRVPNPELAALPRNIAIFLEYLPQVAKQISVMGLPFTASPIGVMETLGRFVDWAISMEGQGVLRWYLKKPSQLLSAPLQLLIHEHAWALRRNELINRSLVEKIPKEHRQTLQDTMYGGGENGAVGRRDVPAGGKAAKMLDEMREAQMRRVLREGEEIGADPVAKMKDLKAKGRIWEYYEDRLPGLVWDSSAQVVVESATGRKVTKVGGWKVNPVLEGEVSQTIINQFKGQVEFMNKWGRDLSLRSVELSRQLKSLRFWNPLTESWQYGLFDNQAALNKFWWPQQYKAWGRITHFINKQWGKMLGKERAMPLWEKTIAQMQRDMAVPATGQGVPTMGAASAKFQISQLNQKGYSLKAKKMIGMEQNLLHQAIGGLGEAEFALRQFKVYQAIARDPNLCFQGKKVQGSFFRKPGEPPGVSKILSEGIERRGRWIKMGSDAMYPGSKTPRWGELAGRWVHEDMFWNLKYAEEIALVASKSGWSRATVFFKSMHTVWNAPTLLRNLYTNILLFAPMNDMIMIGSNLKYWNRGLKEMATGGKLYHHAHRHGAFDGTFAQTELGRTASTAALRGLYVRGKVSLAEVRALPHNLATGNIAGLTEAGRLFLQETPGVMYNAMDTWPRFSHWLKLTDMGRNTKLYKWAAKKVAHDWMNYPDVPGLVQVMRGPTQMSLGGRNLVFALAGKPFFSFTWLSMERTGPIRRWLREKPLIAQIYMNLHEVLSVHNFAEALGGDVDAAKKWMKLIKSQSPRWRRFRYIPMSSTGVIGRAIEAISGTPNIRAEAVKTSRMLAIPVEEYGALPEESYIELKFRGPSPARDAVPFKRKVKTLDNAVELATASLGQWGTTTERRSEVARMVRESLGLEISWDEDIKMWVANKAVDNAELVPMISRWFNIGYYTPVDWLIPQLESYDRSGFLWNFGKQVATNQNPIASIAYVVFSMLGEGAKDPYTGQELYKPGADASETGRVLGNLGAVLKYGVGTMLPPWIPGIGKSWEKLMAIGDKDYRGRVRGSMETWWDVLWGVKFESDVHVPDGIQNQLMRFGEDYRSVEKKIQKWTIEAFKDQNIPKTFDFEELQKIAKMEVTHPEIPPGTARDVLDHYIMLKAREGIKILRELQDAMKEVPALPARYQEEFKEGDMPPSAVRAPGGAMREGGEEISVLAFKNVIDALPVDEWEAMVAKESDIDEEEWMAFLHKELATEEMGPVTRAELEKLGKSYKGKAKGYRMVFIELFGEYDPERKTWSQPRVGIITVLHSLATKFGKYMKKEKTKRMYQPKEKKNGND